MVMEGGGGLFDQFDWSSILDEEPRAAYYSYGNQFGKSQNQRKYFEDAFDDIYNQFLGQLGGQVRQGQAPTMKFNDFLGDYNFDQQYRQMAPSTRYGQPQSTFAPRARFLNY